MPIYEYHCTQCQQEFEVLVRASDTPTCPGCGSPKLTKLLSTPAVHAVDSQMGSARAPGCPYSGSGECDPGACPMQSP